jgi:lipocalin
VVQFSGSTIRKSLWILARKVPIGQDKLDELRQVAKDAGFDVSKLLVAPWAKIKPLDD